MAMDRKIAIVGAGLVGSGWAIVFARAGLRVSIFDKDPLAARSALTGIGARLADLAEAGLIGAPDEALARIGVAATLGEALDGAVYVQESVLERIDVKASLMSEIDAVLGEHAIVGSSSSGIPASQFTAHVRCRARCLVAHPLNPPYLAPIVELVPAPWTSPDSVARARALMAEVGQSPVTMTREAEGFILNRLQGVLLMEAWRLVESGLATVEDIDKTVSQGLGLRWSFLGPFETIDLNAAGGVADYASRLSALYQRVAAETETQAEWSPALVAEVETQLRRTLPFDRLEDRRAWRDRRLMALARHKKTQEANDPGLRRG